MYVFSTGETHYKQGKLVSVMIQFSTVFSSYLSIKHKFTIINLPPPYNWFTFQWNRVPAFLQTFQVYLPTFQAAGWCLRQCWFALYTEPRMHWSLKAQKGTSLLIYFSPFVLFISQWNQTLEQLQHQEWINPGYIMTEVHLRSLWQNLTSSHARWHSLSVPVLPCDVMGGHISAVPNNGTEVSHLNHNGLSPPNKYLSACSCISNSAVQDLMGRYWLPCALSLAKSCFYPECPAQAAMWHQGLFGWHKDQ